MLNAWFRHPYDIEALQICVHRIRDIDEFVGPDIPTAFGAITEMGDDHSKLSVVFHTEVAPLHLVEGDWLVKVNKEDVLFVKQESFNRMFDILEED